MTNDMVEEWSKKIDLLTWANKSRIIALQQSYEKKLAAFKRMWTE